MWIFKENLNLCPCKISTAQPSYLLYFSSHWPCARFINVCFCSDSENQRVKKKKSWIKRKKLERDRRFKEGQRKAKKKTSEIVIEKEIMKEKVKKKKRNKMKKTEKTERIRIAE